MATLIVTTFTCDFSHLDETPADKTITIGWEGQVLEADACAPHIEAIRTALGPYITDMHPANGNSKPPAKTRHRPAAKRQRDAEVREWARKQGLEVSDRGRLPVGIIAKYEAAH
ncbi:MAG: Lsr2 family protein [bacterium]